MMWSFRSRRRESCPAKLGSLILPRKETYFRDSGAKQAAEKLGFWVGRGFIPGAGVSTYFGVANWPAEDIFAVFRSTNRLSCASPGLLVRGSGFSTRMNAPVYRFRALALVAGGPVLSPERPMTTRTAPVSRSSPL